VEAPPSASKRDPEDERERERAEVERLYQEFQFKNHWEVLELERGSSAEDVKAAFVRNAKRFHPDRFRRFPEGEFQEKLSYVFRRINEAHEVLASEARAGYEELADKESQYAESRRNNLPGARGARKGGDAAAAQELFARARVAFDQRDFWQTIQLCQQAVDAAPERAELYHLLGRALSQNPKWRQDAEKNFRIATNLDPWKAEYQVELAKLYDSVGLHLRAKKAYEKARAIDPAVGIPED
jgi:DnaJ-class molecular chaperone